MGWHLAQLNVGRLRAPIDDPATAEFVDALDEINALADRSPGFVWRLQTEDGNATSIRVCDDELFIVNMSTWESVQTLGAYVYRSGHVAFLRRRREWFQRYGTSSLVLWWVPAGTRPTLDEALARLAQLDAAGPTPTAFTFAQPFPPPDADVAEVAADDRHACPA